MFIRHGKEGTAIKGIKTSCVDFDSVGNHVVILRVKDIKVKVGAFRVSNPASLHFFDGIGPIWKDFKIIAELLCEISDGKEPLIELFLFDDCF